MGKWLLSGWARTEMKRQTMKMTGKRRSGKSIGRVILVALLCSLLFAPQGLAQKPPEPAQKKGENKGEAKGEAKGGPPKPVVVAPVAEMSDSPTFMANGVLAPTSKVQLAVDVAGRVLSIHRRAGEFVKSGDVLARLENTDIRLNLRVLEARLKEARANLLLGQQKRDRLKMLYKQNLASEEQFESEQAALKVTEARFASSKAQVEQLKTQLDGLTVRAPIAGQVVKADLDIGQWISPNRSIYEIYNYERFELVVGVPGRYLSKVPGTGDVTILVPEVNATFKGKILAVVRHVEQGSGKFSIRIGMQNSGNLPLSGLLANVAVPVGQSGSVLTVPRDAIVRKGKKTMVVVVREGKAALVPIEVEGNLRGSSVIIKGKLKADEQVVVRGNERLFPGTPVKITGNL